MDPTQNLKEVRELYAKLTEGIGRGHYPRLDAYETDVDRLCELLLVLDVWIRGGGFLPKQWRQPPSHPPECIYNYCPYPGVCQELGCQHRLESKQL